MTRLIVILFLASIYVDFDSYASDDGSASADSSFLDSDFSEYEDALTDIAEEAAAADIAAGVAAADVAAGVASVADTAANLLKPHRVFSKSSSTPIPTLKVEVEDERLMRTALDFALDDEVTEDGTVIVRAPEVLVERAAAAFASVPISSPVRAVRDRFAEVAMRARHKVRALAIDGGGIRVLVATMILEHLVGGRHPVDMFDIMAGTSTGALLVAMLNVPDQEGRPKYTPAFIHNWLEENAGYIYKMRKSPLGPTYSNVNLKRLLDDVFGHLRMSQLINPVIIPAFDIARYTPVLFRSVQPVSLSKYELYKDYLVKDVVLAAMSYPTYFPPVTVYSLTQAGFPDPDSSFELTDAAPYCDNPTMIAVSYAMQCFDLPNMSDVKILSLMTGIKPQTLSYKDLIGRPKYKWPRPVMGMARKGQNLMTHELTVLATSHPHGTDQTATVQYFRPPISLDGAAPTQVDTSRANLAALVADTTNAVVANPSYYERIRKQFAISSRKLTEHKSYLLERRQGAAHNSTIGRESVRESLIPRSIALKRRPLRVLSIDGGGNRGLIPALWLQQVQKLLGHDVTDHFDVFVGTSTGGIIVAGLNIPDTRLEVISQAYGFEKAVDGLVDLYRTRGDEIFDARRKASIGAKYNHEGMEEILNFFFADTPMSQLKKPTMVLTYDVGQDTPVLISSHPTPIDHSMQRYVGYRVKDALRSTSAAPTYFDPAYFNDLMGDRHVMVDGGVFANNPCLAGLVYALQLFPTHKMHDIEIVSLSTGWKPKALDAEGVKSWGKIRWAPEIVSMTMSGSSAAAHAIMSELPVHDYYRVDVGLTGSPAMDDTSEGNIASLARDAERTFHPTNERFRDFMERLRRENPEDGRYYQDMMSRRAMDTEETLSDHT